MPPPADSSSTPPKQPNTTRWALIGGVLVVLAGLGAAALVLVNQGGTSEMADDARPEFVVTQAAAAQPVFQPLFEEGDDPFFPLDDQLLVFTAQTGESVTDEAVQSGLYGGTAENTCDPDRLIAYLYNNPAKGHAWAAAQGIAFEDLGTYIRGLDARVLAAPAVVINHGFDEETGAPIPVESNLEAGTAVLVDANGDIRVRCYCGNPTEPRPVVYRPERCVVGAEMVMSAPGGTEPRADVPATVQVSGQEATAGSQTWTAVMWGNEEAQTGWTPAVNLLQSSCPPVIDPATAVPPAEAELIRDQTTPQPTAEATPTPEPAAAPEPNATPTPEPTTAPRPTPAPTSAPVQPAPTPAPAPPSEPTPTPSPTPEPAPTCPDADDDGVCNVDDNCRDLANVDQADADNDGKGDACDSCTDQDMDLHCSETDDTCPEDYDPSLQDTENDGVGDVCDNCPFDTNPDQADSDGNGIGNRCDNITDPVTPPGGGGTPNPCPAGQEEDYAGTGRCYPTCTLGTMTSGGWCCPGSWTNPAEVALGCWPVCPRGQKSTYDLTRSCVIDNSDPDGSIATSLWGHA